MKRNAGKKKTDLRGNSVIKRHAVLLLTIWTLFIAGLIVWVFKIERSNIVEQSRIEARSIWEHNVSYRRWVSRMGGVYARRDKLRPNPYLKIPDRDKRTTDGVELTMANPAYMTSQVFAIIKEASSLPIINRIVSDNYLNPANKTDEWEAAGMRAFYKGAQEISEIRDMNGQPYMRFFKPLQVEKGCLKCHGQQGYKVGDIRGGISVAVPMKPYYALESLSRKNSLVVFALLWTSGLGGIGFFMKSIQKNQQLILESQARFRQLFDTAAVPLCLVNREGELVDFNDSFERTFGYTREDVPTLEQWWQLAYPDPEYRKWVVPTWEAAVRRAAEERTKIEPIEYRVTCKNGDVRTMVISGTTLGSDVLATFFDVTERKRVEEELRLQTEELDRYFSMALTLFCIADTEGHFRRLNKLWETTLGYSLDELTGKRFLDFIHPGDIEATRHALARLEAQEYVVDFVNRYRAKNGEYRWIEWRAIPSGKLIFAAATDITERKKAEEKILKLNEELDQRVKDRTSELANKNTELERLNRLFVGRELRMIELKEKISALEGKNSGEKTS